ncbi:hypothetical protein RBS60_10990 [Sinomonas sp. ASV486]|nr:hypothetical protein [Sinomonas sp. ASV486]MDQ4490723.1 hypothetical protein [Sinomonas sp. ASV486]
MQVDLDPKTYERIKMIARREDRLIKGVVRRAIEAAYPEDAEEARDDGDR